MTLLLKMGPNFDLRGSIHLNPGNIFMAIFIDLWLCLFTTELCSAVQVRSLYIKDAVLEQLGRDWRFSLYNNKYHIIQILFHIFLDGNYSTKSILEFVMTWPMKTLSNKCQTNIKGGTLTNFAIGIHGVNPTKTW